MNFITAHSLHDDAEQAVAELKSQFGDFTPKIILFFTGSKYQPEVISSKIQEAFPEAVTFGCTSAGEIVSGKMLKNSVVAMGFNVTVIQDFHVEVIENLDSAEGVGAAFAGFENHFNTPAIELDYDEYFGIVLVDGLSGAEERLMDQIGDKTNALFVGASAGDDLKFSKTLIYANGKTYSNAALLALIKPGVPFDFIKTQSFTQRQEKLVVTKADEASRQVIEFNGKPAAQAYAEAVGTTVEEAENYFMRNPVGLMVDGEPYVRSPQKFEGDRIQFYCNILEGMELSLLESTDINADTRQVIEQKAKDFGQLSGIINFNCVLRTLDLEQQGGTEEYGCIFTDIPTIGFSTYGEEFLGHMNQTATMIVFG